MSAAAAPPVVVDLKVVLLGKVAVGKTALLERFLHERFLPGYQTTIGAAYGSKRVRTRPPGGRSVVLGVWDTTGEEKYESLARIYYRGSKAAVLCYDIADPDSLSRARFWAEELAKCEPSCRLYLAGCKLDLAAGDPEARRVSPGAVRQLAADLGATAVETSSKTGENVEELFTTITEDFVCGGGGGGGGSGDDAKNPAISLHSRQQQPSQGKQCGC